MFLVTRNVQVFRHQIQEICVYMYCGSMSAKIRKMSESSALSPSCKDLAPSGENRGPSKTKPDASNAANSENAPSVFDGKVRLSSPIGYIRSCFKSKNGTPRQPSVCSYSRAKLRILKSAFACPDHSLDGLAAFSHVWILFVFHQNGQESFTKAKVKPPRLDGKKVGVFASRSPHRPSPIGLTLARLDKVEGDTVHLSGMDMIEGTPVLDIKPYVPEYDRPVQTGAPPPRLEHLRSELIPESGDKPETIETRASTSDLLDNNADLKRARCNAGLQHKMHRANERSRSDLTRVAMSVAERDTDSQDAPKEAMSSHSSSRRTASDLEQCSILDESMDCDGTSLNEKEGVEGLDVSGDGVRVAEWISAPPIRRLSVRFTPTAEGQLSSFWQEQNKDSADHKQEFLQDEREARSAIEDILSADPRSVYRRNSCSDKLYFFTIDNLHITSWFGPDFAEVLNVQPMSCANIPVKTS